MRTELVQALTDAYDAVEPLVIGLTAPSQRVDVLVVLENKIAEILTDEEYVVFSEGYDKDGNPVIGA